MLASARIRKKLRKVTIKPSATVAQKLEAPLINPPLREGKNGRGGVKKSSIFYLGDDTIPGDGQVKKFSSPPPPTIFSSGQNIKNIENARYTSKNMKISENAKYT